MYSMIYISRVRVHVQYDIYIYISRVRVRYNIYNLLLCSGSMWIFHIQGEIDTFQLTANAQYLSISASPYGVMVEYIYVFSLCCNSLITVQGAQWDRGNNNPIIHQFFMTVTTGMDLI